MTMQRCFCNFCEIISQIMNQIFNANPISSSTNLINQINFKYWSLIAFMMRNHEKIPKKSLKKNLLAKPTFESNKTVLREFADFVWKLDFIFFEIIDLQQHLISTIMTKKSLHFQFFFIMNDHEIFKKEKNEISRKWVYANDDFFLSLNHLHDSWEEIKKKSFLFLFIDRSIGCFLAFCHQTALLQRCNSSCYKKFCKKESKKNKTNCKNKHKNNCKKKRKNNCKKKNEKKKPNCKKKQKKKYELKKIQQKWIQIKKLKRTQLLKKQQTRIQNNNQIRSQKKKPIIKPKKNKQKDTTRIKSNCKKMKSKARWKNKKNKLNWHSTDKIHRYKMTIEFRKF